MLLDTHIWIRWLNEPTGSFVLPSNIIHHIEHAETLEINVMSCWELAKLVKRNRITLPFPLRQWIDLSSQYNDIRVLPVQTDIALLAEKLPEHHRDPADRFIIATSIFYNMPLVSLDSKFPQYQELKGLLIQT